MVEEKDDQVPLIIKLVVDMIQAGELDKMFKKQEDVDNLIVNDEKLTLYAWFGRNADSNHDTEIDFLTSIPATEFADIDISRYVITKSYSLLNHKFSTIADIIKNPMN